MIRLKILMMGKSVNSEFKKAISKSKLISLNRFIFSIGVRYIGQAAKVLQLFIIKGTKTFHK